MSFFVVIISRVAAGKPVIRATFGGWPPRVFHQLWSANTHRRKKNTSKKREANGKEIKEQAISLLCGLVLPPPPPQESISMAGKRREEGGWKEM